MSLTRRTIALIAAIALLAMACTPTDDEPAADDQPAPSSPEDTAGAEPIAGEDPTPTEDPTPDDATPPAGPSVEPAACEFDVPPGRSVECGWLEVPADRSDAGSGKIRLHVAVFASENSNPAPDPVVYLEGGPGGDALEVIPLAFEDRFAHLLADRDVVFFDQRGTGFSEPSLACPEVRELGLDLLDDDLPLEDIVAQQQVTILECRDRLAAEGADLDSFNSAESAADLDDLRAALGYGQWNLYGISYGTRLALTTMRDFPDGIRSVILDSVYPPQVDLIGSVPENLDRALTELFDGCAADAACNAAYPDLETTFYELIAELDETPIRAPVTDVFTGTEYDAVFTGASVGSIVFQGLYARDAIEVLPRMITNVANGETYELSVLASTFVANGEFVSVGMQFSVQCNEEAVFTDPATVTAASEAFPELRTIFQGSANLGGQFFTTCAAWGAGEATSLENLPVSSDIPALVLAGEYDPITPPAWGMLAAETLGQATYVEFPGVGHGPSSDGECPQSLLRQFLSAPDGALDLGCVDGMEGPAFASPGRPTPDVTLVGFSETVFGPTVSGVVPEGWESVGPGAWSRGVNAFDQTVLLQQFAPGTDPTTLLAFVGPQFGLEANPTQSSSYEAPDGTWAIYLGETVGATASVALSATDGGTLIVVLIAPPAESDVLEEQVLFPVLDAIGVG